MNLKQLRRDRKKQKPSDNGITCYNDLQRLLCRFCELKGIRILPMGANLVAEMPSGVLLTVFARPKFAHGWRTVYKFHAFAHYPYRKMHNGLFIQEPQTTYLRDKLEYAITQLLKKREYEKRIKRH